MRGEPETIDLDVLLGASRRTLVAAAHELKAPLSLIRMYASKLEDSEITPAQRKQYNARLLFTAEQMLHLTGGILEGFRWEQGCLPLEPVNAHMICEEVLHELAPVALELNQTLSYAPVKRPLVAVGHPLLLKNVLFNVVFNALKHTPPETIVTIGAKRQLERTYISVVDTGPGFQKQTIEHINNDMGNRLQAAHSRGSTGLGLAVAKQLMRAMDGALQLKASPKGGYCLVSLRNSRQLTFSL